MASDARDVEYDIIARDKTGPGTKSAADNFDRLHDKVKKGNDRLGEDSRRSGLKAGVAFGTGLVKEATRTISVAKASLTPVLVGVGVAAAPVIASALGGAITAGVAGGAVGAGLLIAAQDPRVKAAGTVVGQTLSRAISADASAFVPETLKALNHVRSAFDSWRPLLRDIFNDAAGYVRPLTIGLTKAGDALLPGIRDATRNAEPLVDMFARQLPKAGEVFAGVLRDASKNAENSAATIGGILTIAEAQVVGIGKIIEAANSDVGQLFWGQIAGLGKLMDDGEESTDSWSESFNNFIDQMQNVTTTTAAANVQIRTQQQLLNEGRANNLSLAEAQTRASVAVRETTAQIKENNKEIKNSKERADANALALIGLAQQLETARTATEKMYGAGQQANQVAAQNRAAFIAAAQAAGYTAKEAANLADKYLGIPPKVETKATLDKSAADRKAAELEALLDWTTRSRAVSITVNYKQGVGVRVPGRGTITQFDAVHHFQAADNTAGQARSRTGGPTPVSVTSQVRVDLDGAPFRAYTAQAVDAADERRRWREAVGKR